MTPQTIADEIRCTIEDDNFDDLEEKIEAIELLTDFENSATTRACSMCDTIQGRFTDECTGADLGRCEPCKGIGYIAL